MSDKTRPTVYLIGPIDSAKDPRSAFDYVDKHISSLGHITINPVKNEKTKTGLEVEDSLDYIRKCWKTGRSEEFLDIMRKIWIADLKAVHKADYLVLHFEEENSGGGTFLEMTIASLYSLLSLIIQDVETDPGKKAYLRTAKYALQEGGLPKKPIYWVCTGPSTSINTTLKFLVYLSGGQMFSTYKELIEFLEEKYGRFPIIESKEREEKKHD